MLIAAVHTVQGKGIGKGEEIEIGKGEGIGEGEGIETGEG